MKFNSVGENNLVVRQRKTFVSTLEVFNDKDLQTETLYIPSSKKQEGIDAVYIDSFKNGWFIQVTINTRHPALDVKIAKDQFPSISKWKLCLIHPNGKKYSLPAVQCGKKAMAIEKYESIVNYFPFISRT